MYFFIGKDLIGTSLVKPNISNEKQNTHLEFRDIINDIKNLVPETVLLEGNYELITSLKFKPIVFGSLFFLGHGIDKMLSPRRLRTIIPLYISRDTLEDSIQIYQPAGMVDFYTSLQNHPGIVGHKSLTEKLDVEVNEIYETEAYILMYSNKHKTLGPFLVEYFQAYQEMFPQYFEPDPEV